MYPENPLEARGYNSGKVLKISIKGVVSMCINGF